MKAVLDANQYISALLKPDGLQAALFKYGAEGRFALVLSDHILEEIVRVLSYSKILKRLPISLPQVERFLRAVTEVAEFVTGTMHVTTTCPDRDDWHYLAAAKEADADCLVSGDRHLLDLGDFEGIPILTTSEFLHPLPLY